MNYLIFILAIATLILAYYFKMLRWRQFVEIYEKPQNDILIKSLAIGYIINFFVPFHIGDFIKGIYAGRKMKNGVCFAIATVIIEEYLDIIVVGFLFLLFYLCDFNKDSLLYSVLFYFGCSIILLIFSLLAINYSKHPKIFIKKISSIFNDEIELRILYFLWTIISVFKDMYINVSKKKLIFNTALIWILYIVSYYLLALFLSDFLNNVKSINIFNLLCNGNKIFMPLHNSRNSILQSTLIISLYILISSIGLYIISILKCEANVILADNFEQELEVKYLKLLPHVNKDEKLGFLKAYFSGVDREYFKKYLKINRNISIIHDYSAGSNATTMLCTNGKERFFRKYAFGEDAKKLYEQIKWINKHKSALTLPQIILEDMGEGYCYYDMPYENVCVGFFDYIHSMSVEKSWNIMKQALNELEENLYCLNSRKADKNTIKEYIDIKVIKNIEKINKARSLKKLIEYDEIVVNGIKYKNLSYFSKYFSFDFLYDVFKEDIYSDIHGDLTIENLICRRNSDCKKNYYIIDPNTGNIHDSPNLDYSKLLQSLHGGYEFLMHTKNVEVDKNEINYINTKSSLYTELFKRYKKFLDERFTYNKVKSIFFHEIIHWLRLMPYKIEKDGKRAAMFYAGLIIVLNEVAQMYEEK